MKKYFEELSDSRQKGKIKYNLAEVVVMAIIAVTAGAEHWNEIALYCKNKEKNPALHTAPNTNVNQAN